MLDFKKKLFDNFIDQFNYYFIVWAFFCLLKTLSCFFKIIKSNQIVYLRVTGGEVPGGSSLAPKIGPLGLAPKKVGDDIAKATAEWKGLRLTVCLEIQNRVAKVVIIPSASSLVVKALKEPPRDRKKVKNIKHNGNITLEDIYSIARTMRPRSMAREFKGTVKEILGTAHSIGCTIDGKTAPQVTEMINNGEIQVPEK